MVTRTFLGWEHPFLNAATDWLLERRDELPESLVIVPTSQAGRQLRDAMAKSAGALLTPKISTPGALMKTPNPAIAANWTEKLAWQETLEKIDDWSAFEHLFPNAPETTGEWAGGLAEELLSLRRALQENGLTLLHASRLLKSSVEAERWAALGELEKKMEKQLRDWSYDSRSQTLAQGIQLPTDITQVFLVGITEMPPLLERSLQESELPITALIAAPESEKNQFSETGLPLESWTERNLPWPKNKEEGVHVTYDVREQSKQALHCVSAANTEHEDLAIGSADIDAGDSIASTFTDAGWTAFHPAAKPITTGARRWLATWSSWLTEPKLITLTDLLALPETAALIEQNRAKSAFELARVRNDWMVTRVDDLRHRVSQGRFHSKSQQIAATNSMKVADTLDQWRRMFLRNDFTKPTQRILDTLASHSEETASEATEIIAWFDEAKPLIKKLDRSAKFWIDLMLNDLPAPTNQPPEGRIIDIQGWLELLFEPGKHLVLCGMNEGKVPANNTGDPWLGESANEFLGLLTNTKRAARDAFLYQAMIEARKGDGKVDLICAKTSDGGDPLMPSRLLLADDGADLAKRVQHLFQEVTPPESKLRWEKEWEWKPPTVDAPKKISATALRDYLACPFRFYLKHQLGMRSEEPERIEWNARDFGNVAHEVLESFGKDPEAKSSTDAKFIHDWLLAEIEKVIHASFGKQIPLAVRIQAESLRQRLKWFSQVQVNMREDGWEIAETEQEYPIMLGSIEIKTRIDRIDRHTESGLLRVIDYKTGNVTSVDGAHRTRISASTVLPEHLSEDGPAVYTDIHGKKPTDYRWTNLQLPLYALAIYQRDKALPVPCYISLGDNEKKVALHPWDNFTMEDMEAAKECADWIAQQIIAGVYWPPAEKPKYDDFALLTASRPITEMFSSI